MMIAGPMVWPDRLVAAPRGTIGTRSSAAIGTAPPRRRPSAGRRRRSARSGRGWRRSRTARACPGRSRPRPVIRGLISGTRGSKRRVEARQQRAWFPARKVTANHHSSSRRRLLGGILEQHGQRKDGTPGSAPHPHRVPLRMREKGDIRPALEVSGSVDRKMNSTNPRQPLCPGKHTKLQEQRAGDFNVSRSRFLCDDLAVDDLVKQIAPIAAARGWRACLARSRSRLPSDRVRSMLSRCSCFPPSAKPILR